MKAARRGKASSRLNASVKSNRGSKTWHAQYIRYLNRPEERFARAYAQYITTKSQDPALLRQFAAQRAGGYGEYMYHSDAEFAKVSAAFDKLLA
jgi:hypothetical protein